MADRYNPLFLCADESCPVWPGRPITAHWGIDDPAAATDSPKQIHRAFTNAHHLLQRRIGLLQALKIEGLERLALKTRVRDIGQSS